ncbi:MAG: hypothetical protein PSV46_07130, partial [Reyranella sp.]|nr:hypothetical protein [Reyranella sp.]
EHDLAKVGVEGSNPFARSNFLPWKPMWANLEDLEKAVAELPVEQLARFRVWFEEFKATHFDQKIERDAAAGRLDRLAEQALSDFRAGR